QQQLATGRGRSHGRGHRRSRRASTCRALCGLAHCRYSRLLHGCDPMRWVRHQWAHDAERMSRHMGESRLPDDEEFQDLVQDVYATGGTLGEKLGIRFSEISVQRLVASMPVKGNTQPAGLLHGGASDALAETMGSVG